MVVTRKCGTDSLVANRIFCFAITKGYAYVRVHTLFTIHPSRTKLLVNSRELIPSFARELLYTPCDSHSLAIIIIVPPKLIP